MLVQYWPFQSYSMFCCNGEAISTRFRIRTSHSKIETYDESYYQGASISVSLVKKHYGNQDPWKSVAGEDRSGRLGKATDLFEASGHYYHEQFMESFSSTYYSKSDYDRAWSSQEWKGEATTYDRSGRLENFLENGTTSSTDHEEILLDGTAQPVRYGEPLRDRSGRLGNINFKKWQTLTTFIMGSDPTELECL